MASDPTPRFTVSWSQRGLDRVRRMSERAREIGILADWTQTLRRILDRLETEPRVHGDPLYSLRSLELLVHRLIVDRVEVLYGVHETEPQVFI
jgi:hypothetical protein